MTATNENDLDASKDDLALGENIKVKFKQKRSRRASIALLAEMFLFLLSA